MNDSAADLIYRNSNIYVVDGGTGNLRRLTAQTACGEVLRSHDGKLVAFAGYPASKASYQASEVFVLPSTAARCGQISAGRDRDPGNLIWRAMAAAAILCRRSRQSDVYFCGFQGGPRKRRQAITRFRSSPSREMESALLLRATVDRPPTWHALISRRKGAYSSSHRSHDDRASGIAWARWRRSPTIDWRRDDRRWIVKPPSFDRSKSSNDHGNPRRPARLVQRRIPAPQFQNFAANGFVVLYTNPGAALGTVSLSEMRSSARIRGRLR